MNDNYQIMCKIQPEIDKWFEYYDENSYLKS